MADIQRDKDIIKTPPFVVDPIFELPPDLDEGSYSNSVRSDAGATGADVVDDELVDVEKPDPDATDDPTKGPLKPFVPTLDPRPMGAPVNITVKSQTFRFAPDGSYVVDVILEFPDVAGATSYEVRLAK